MLLFPDQIAGFIINLLGVTSEPTQAGIALLVLVCYFGVLVTLVGGFTVSYLKRKSFK